VSPKVSICIPTYNRKDYLKETLDSVFAQTYKDYEVIVVDDGSTDGTKDMLDHFAYKLRYHWQANAGVAAARNILITLARGEFITFIDSDDLFLPQALERLLTAIGNESQDVIAYSPYLRIDQNGKIIGKSKRRRHNGYITSQLFQHVFVQTLGSLFPKKFLEDAGGFDQSLLVAEDYDLWLRLSLKHPFVGLGELTSKRRRHSNCISNSSFKGYSTVLKVLERFYYENGGSQVIRKRPAMRRLSRVACRAGRCAVNEGLLRQGRQLLRQSFRRHPNIKSLTYLAMSLQPSRPAR